MTLFLAYHREIENWGPNSNVITDKKLLTAHESFLRDFQRVMEDPTFADTTLICEGVEIPCHRVFLSAKSEVFRTMFSGDNFLEGLYFKTVDPYP
jgi:hypothetical protein